MRKIIGYIPVILLVISIVGASAAYGQEEEDFFVEEKIASKGRAVALSVLFSGLGQMSSGHKIKGSVLFISEIMALSFTVNANENYKTQLTRFDQRKEEYDGLKSGGSYDEAVEKWKSLNEINDDLDHFHKLRMTFGTIAIGIYLYNLIDALFINAYGGPERQVADQPKFHVQFRAVHNAPGAGVVVNF